MPRELPTLNELCLQRAARLLKYWNTAIPLTYNPFTLLPSTIIDTLITYVTEISTVVPLESSDLRLLLTSGKVRRFTLDDRPSEKPINMSSETAKKILLDLLSSNCDLTKVKVNLVWKDRRNLHILTPVLDRLLSEAQNVKHVESSIEFDLHVLCNSLQLERLILHFPLKSHIYDFLEVNGQLRPNVSLKHIEVFEDRQHQLSHLDVAVILKYCTELVSINCDIAKSLEYLHGEELLDGSLTHQYKIRKCCLGIPETFESKVDVVGVRDGILVASLACPDLRDLKIYVNDDDFISALSQCQSLRILRIKLQPMIFQVYNFVKTRLLLEQPNIGHNLKTLVLWNFIEVDFPLVGMCCPNLEVLKVDYVKRDVPKEYSPTSFRKLRTLDVCNRRYTDCEQDVIIGILSNATDLEEVKIRLAGKLTDRVLEGILKKNCLPKLKKLCVPKCGLSVRGWRYLGCRLTALENLNVSSTDLNFLEVVAAVREVNQRVIMKSDY